MTLIILLIVLLIERVGLNSSRWQASTYVNWYAGKYAKKLKEDDAMSLLFFALAPAIIVGVLLYLFDSRLVDFIFGLLALGICIGHYPIRQLYRQYLNAHERDDKEAVAIIHQQLSNQSSVDDVKDSIGETLVWVNFKFYAAPIFFFVVLGVPGVVLYTTMLFLTDESLPDKQQARLNRWLEWLYFIPARLVSLGYMFVGHFANGLDAWLRLAGDLDKSSRFTLTRVAMAAEGEIESSKVSETDDRTDVPSSSDDADGTTPTNNALTYFNAEVMVRLAKRNMVLFLVVVALLTLYGQIV